MTNFHFPSKHSYYLSFTFPMAHIVSRVETSNNLRLLYAGACKCRGSLPTNLIRVVSWLPISISHRRYTHRLHEIKSCKWHCLHRYLFSSTHTISSHIGSTSLRWVSPCAIDLAFHAMFEICYSMLRKMHLVHIAAASQCRIQLGLYNFVLS